MFKLVKERTAWWPVAFLIADADGGTATSVRIELRFRLVDVDAAVDLIGAADAIDVAAGERKLSARFADFVIGTEAAPGIATGWRGVAGENDEPLAWSREAVEALLAVPGVFPAVVSAYRDALAGRAETREKN